MGPTDRLFCPLLARQGPLICGRRLELAGWALLDAGVREVRVAVGECEQAADLEPDGNLEITAPDGGQGAVAFSVELDLSGLEAGEHVLTLTASGPGGQITQDRKLQVIPHDVVEGDAMAPVRAGRPSMA